MGGWLEQARDRSFEIRVDGMEGTRAFQWSPTSSSTDTVPNIGDSQKIGLDATGRQDRSSAVDHPLQFNRQSRHLD